MTATAPIPLLDLTAQYATIRDEVGSAIQRVLESQHFILGPEVESLEREVAQYSHCCFAVGVSSGTDALLACLMAIGIESGDEVITTPYTFFATAGSISRLGARPIFVDIDPQTYNIDPKKIDAVVTDRTKAILPVHLFGQMADMDPIMEIARRRNLFVVEDAAQAIGAEYKGQRAGSIGDLGCLSFFPSKNLGACGDGGMVTGNNPELVERVRVLRSHGSKPKYFHKIVGGNFRLDAIQAAVLRVKLKYLDDWTAARQQNAAIYRSLFAEFNLSGRERDAPSTRDGAQVGMPIEVDHMRHIYNQFVVRVKGSKRDALMAYLRQHGIASEVYYPLPLHLQECFACLQGRAGDFPASESAAKETLALPIYPELTKAVQRTVVETIADFFSETAGLL
jgi:dTDP-4-amino-4,6-dideoxygalactose transaminase